VARRIVWTEPAVEIETEPRYIERDSPRYAAALVRDAWDTVRSLKQFSFRGRMVPELSDPDVREVFVGRFRLIYKVREEQVFILGFIHGSRDLPGAWARERSGE